MPAPPALVFTGRSHWHLSSCVYGLRGFKRITRICRGGESAWGIKSIGVRGVTDFEGLEESVRLQQRVEGREHE
jgi:hypothetical protein